MKHSSEVLRKCLFRWSKVTILWNFECFIVSIVLDFDNFHRFTLVLLLLILMEILLYFVKVKVWSPK